MSRSPYFFLEKYNRNTKAYEEVAPFVRDNENVELFPFNGAHEMFSILANDGIYPHMNGIHGGLPEDVTDGIVNALIRDEDVFADNDVDSKDLPRLLEEREQDVRWFTYADMEIYLLKNPTVSDYNEFTETSIEVENPLNFLKKRVDAFLEVWDTWGDWVDELSLIRIIYWIW